MDGSITIPCPGCHREQLIEIGKDNYQLDEQGITHPEFVCTAKTNGHYICFFSDYVKIKNFKSLSL